MDNKRAPTPSVYLASRKLRGEIMSPLPGADDGTDLESTRYFTPHGVAEGLVFAGPFPTHRLCHRFRITMIWLSTW